MNYEYEYERALIFIERKTTVHVATNNFFVNGILLEVTTKHFVIKDRKDGTEKFIFFEELKKGLEPFKEVEE